MASGILPSPKINTLGPGITGPDYSFAESIPTPNAIGVRDGDDVNSVIGAVKGVAYYSDVIGFGGPSSFMSQGMGLKPLGVQVWMKTGVQCSNGADMWSYMDGIPTGNALGSTLAKGLADARLPGLKGLAPGIMEDIQSALDPTPIMESVFGTGYAVCKRVEKPVGDQDGNISKIDAKGNTVYYVENPETVVRRDGRSYQTRWTMDHTITKSEWDKMPKTFCPNGSAKKGGSCSEPFRGSMKSPFRSTSTSQSWKNLVLVGFALGGLYILSYMRLRSKR
jgi:hypothetical protein